MEIFECIKTSDGQLWDDWDKALDHCENAFGEELDGLLKGVNLGHRNMMAVMRAIIEKPDEFKALSKCVKEYHDIKGFIKND